MKSNFSSPGFLWPLLTLVCLLIILFGLNQTLKQTTLAITKKRKLIFGTVLLIAGWCALLAVLSYNGFFANFSAFPPRPALAVLIPLPFILLFTFSKTGTKLLQ